MTRTAEQAVQWCSQAKVAQQLPCEGHDLRNLRPADRHRDQARGG